jgi:hypothetical protein
MLVSVKLDAGFIEESADRRLGMTFPVTLPSSRDSARLVKGGQAKNQEAGVSIRCPICTTALTILTS